MGVTILFPCIIQCSCRKEDEQSVKDADGNSYTTVKIGQQTWMAENLKTTRYNDGTPITLITHPSMWYNLMGTYCWYDNDISHKDSYGALYNWYAVETGKLCPKGWHVPTDDEWTILTDYLGTDSVAGGMMKEKGTAHWRTPNKGATNSSGFTALPGGYRGGTTGYFGDIGYFGNWWSSSSSFANKAWLRKMYYDNTKMVRYDLLKTYGFSVRCVKDN